MRRASKGKKFKGCSKTMKRISTRRNVLSPAAIFSLPNELITDVITRVAASSLTGLFNVKLSCKVFHEAADNEEHIHQQVSLEKFPVCSWSKSKGAASFLDRCRESGNPEALYRHGVVQYFTYMKLEAGLENLRRASNAGHLGASYSLGILLICSGGDEFRQQGMQLLRTVAMERKRVKECRKQLKNILSNIWRNNKSLKPKPNCCLLQEQHKIKQGWSDDEDDQYDTECENCRCHYEVISICKMIHIEYYY